MKLTFLGATHEVTGSCFLLEACGKRVLVDCGMEQGPDIYKNEELPVKASDVDMVLLTHAHMDHSGKLPLLYRQGFQGQIFATASTTDLCNIMLRDSANIQMFEAEWRNRKGKRAGREPVEPLYDMDDAIGVLKCFVECEYKKEIRIAEGMRIQFTDAGHLLGSSSIEVWIREGETEKKLVFSGDIGNTNQPLIRDPQYPTQADYVLMESTYGDRSHDAPADYATALAEVIQRTFDRRGNVVVPSFAVGRTQEMLYFIRRIKEEGLVHGHDGFEVWVDSPLAIEATNIFRQHMWSDFDDEATELIERGINPIGFEGLRTSVTAEDSRAINEKPQPKVILSASGMCDAGRIKHHLKHNLWRKESTILFVGYQAHGTLGRALLEGAEHVKLFGEEVAVRAKVVKNKVAPPFREAYFDIMFGEGISKSGELLDLAVQLGIVQKSGAWFGYGETRLGQGRDNTKIYLEEHPELFAEIEKQVRENADKLNAGKKGAAAKKKASIDDAPDVAKPAAKAEAPAPAAPAKRASIDIMVEDDE